jgi:predicted TIM-barrel fold metal-dependent hydrolase
MPNFPIIDTHLNIWDIERLKNSAFDGHELLGRSYHIEDFQEDRDIDN